MGTSLPGITAQQINDLVANLPSRLIDLLLYQLLSRVPKIGAALEVFGVIERVHHAGNPGNPTEPAFDAIALHLDRLLATLTNPIAQLQSLYDWGAPGLDATALLTVLEGALGAGLGLPVRLDTTTNPITLEVLGVDLRPTSSGSPPGSPSNWCSQLRSIAPARSRSHRRRGSPRSSPRPRSPRKSAAPCDHRSISNSSRRPVN